MTTKIAAGLCLLMLCLTVSAKVLYKTVKENGQVVYSDVPSQDSVAVDLSATNTAVIPALSHTPTNSRNAAKTNKPPKPAIDYFVTIQSPLPEQTIRNNSGSVSVTASVEPKKAGKFQLMMDKQVIATQASSSFELENLERGAHVIQVNFLSNSGKILASSTPQTFYLHKASALINAN